MSRTVEVRSSQATRDVLARLHDRTIVAVLVPNNEAGMQSFSSALVRFSTGSDVLFYVEAAELSLAADTAAEFFVIGAQRVADDGLKMTQWPNGPPIMWTPRYAHLLATAITGVSILRSTDSVTTAEGGSVVAVRVDGGVVVEFGAHRLVIRATDVMPMTMNIALCRGDLAKSQDEVEEPIAIRSCSAAVE